MEDQKENLEPEVSQNNHETDLAKPDSDYRRCICCGGPADVEH